MGTERHQALARMMFLATALAVLLAGCSGSSSAISQSRTSTSFPTATPTAAATPTPTLSQLSAYLISAGQVYAVHADSGTVRWHAVVDRAEAWGPAVSGDLVYAVESELVALRAADGSVAWHQPTPYFSHSVIVADGKVYLISPLGDVDAYSASDGQHLWQRAHNACWLGASITADATAVYLVPLRDPRQGSGSTCDTRTLALRPSDGTPLWQAQIGSGEALGSLSAVNSVLYINGTAQLFAVRAADGSVLWQHPTGDRNFDWQPVVSGDVVYAATTQAIYALRTADGGEIWHLSGFVSAPPAADGHTLYVVEQGGVLQALNSADGHLLWEFRHGSGMTAPTVQNGVVYVNADDCPSSPSGGCGGPFNLYAVQASTGAQLWSAQTPSGSRTVVIAP